MYDVMMIVTALYVLYLAALGLLWVYAQICKAIFWRRIKRLNRS